MQRIQDNYTLTSPAPQLETTHQIDAVITPAPKVLMVGSDPERTLGGISAVINALLCSPAMAEFDIRFIGSQADDYGPFGKFILAGYSLLIFGLQIVWWRPQMAYVHVGSNASLYRKVPFLVLARWLKLRVVAHFHAGDFTHYYSKQSRFGQSLIRYGLDCSHRIIAVSKATQDVLNELLPEAIVSLIPNGIDLSAFANTKEKDGEGVRLLFVGAMGRLKGEKDLIQAIKKIEDQCHLKAMLLGHGAEHIRPVCEESGVMQMIEHLGPIPMTQRAEYFRKADIFVLPSYGEGFPVSVLEAMAACLPIIATQVGGIPELIENGKEGFLIEAGDIDALADRILKLAQDAALRKQMGAQGRQKVRQYDNEVIAQKLVSHLREEMPGYRNNQEAHSIN